MSRVVFDIETVGVDFKSLDEEVQKYFLRFAKTKEEITAVHESTSFFPLTGEVVAIGMLNPDSDKGAVYYQWPADDPPLPFEADGFKYETGSEAGILKKFWETVKDYKTIVTFNGRGFDCPFILLRSSVHKIKPTKELMPNRYGDQHIDLMDRLTFYGATRRFSLDMYTRMYGIKSPKGLMTGYEVGDNFRAGKYREIAEYCAGDLRATAEIFDRWEKYVR